MHGAQLYWYRDGQSNLVYKGDYGQIIKGVFNASSAKSGFALDHSRTWVERGNCDDGGSIISTTGDAYMFSSRRMLLTAVQTGNNSYFGGCDRLSVVADQSAVTGIMAAHWSNFEIKSGGKTGSAQAGAVRGDLNIQSGSTLSANGAACFLAACEALSASTHTGRYSVIGVPLPQAGTFDCYADIAASTGSTAGTGTHQSITAANFLIVYINGTIGYVPVLSA
jgi:hypothetical protein